MVEARKVLAGVLLRSAGAAETLRAAPGKVLYVPDDHGLLSEVDGNHLDWASHLARVRA